MVHIITYLLYFRQYTLQITNSSLKTLGLPLHLHISKGDVLIADNPNLCYVWQDIFVETVTIADNGTAYIYGNKDEQECSEYAMNLTLRIYGGQFFLF